MQLAKRREWATSGLVVFGATVLDNRLRAGAGEMDGIRSALRVLLVGAPGDGSPPHRGPECVDRGCAQFSLGLDARKPLTDAQDQEIANWRLRAAGDAATSTIRGGARRLALSVLALMEQLEDNHVALAAHVSELAPRLQKIRGLGAVTGAILLAAYSHKGRIRNEAAFASLAGAAPLQASSGNTTRHRLNRHGDRQLNRALDVIAQVRMSCDAKTKDYVDRRTAEGKSRREIRRSLKRYIVRQLFRPLNAAMT